MQDRFYSIVTSIIEPSDKILIAASGGLDSTVLLDLAASANLNFCVAHVNFQLRKDESDGDELFVQALAERYKVPFFSTRFNTLSFSKEQRSSIQMAARELRYNWFAEIMNTQKIDYLFTAHHLNDNLETSILNFVRGTGISGLRGMNLQSNTRLRPLLQFSRKEIESYAKEKHLAWREDSSNKSVDYNRNFIRHAVFPKLKELNPSLENTFANNVKRFLAQEELVSFAINNLKDRYLTKDRDHITISKKIVDGFKNRAGILWELCKEYGFNLSQCESVIKVLDGEAGKQFHSDHYILTIDRDCIIISRSSPDVTHLEISDKDEFISTATFDLLISTVSQSKFTSDQLDANLNKANLTFPLLLRNWKSGDFFYPLGMNNKKKISDFLIDEKISMADKSKVLVLESDGKIVWVVGHRIDNRFKITSDTKSSITLKIKYRN